MAAPLLHQLPAAHHLAQQLRQTLRRLSTQTQRLDDLRRAEDLLRLTLKQIPNRLFFNIHGALFYHTSPTPRKQVSGVQGARGSFVDTENRRGEQRNTEKDCQREGTADLADFEQIYGVLSHAGRIREVWKFRSLEAWSSWSLARRPAGAVCSPWPWKVCPFGPARSVLRSPGRKAPLVSSWETKSGPGDRDRLVRIGNAGLTYRWLCASPARARR